jgi:hypothetical protein
LSCKYKGACVINTQFVKNFFNTPVDNKTANLQ